MRTGRQALLLAASLLTPAPEAVARDGSASGVAPLGRLFEGLPYKVVVVGPVAFVALDTGLATYDIRDPAHPVRLGHVYLPSPALDVAVQGSHAYVADGENGLQVIGIADPVNLTRVGSFVVGSQVTGGTRSVAVGGSIAFLGEAGKDIAGADLFGLRTVNVGDPSNPTAIGFLPLPNGVLHVALSGTTAVVGTGSKQTGSHGLYLIDVTNPAAPSLTGTLALPRPVHEIGLSGTVAFLATGLPSTGALVSVDLSNPAAPAVLASYPLDAPALGIALSSGVAAVAAGSLGMLTFDVSNPVSPLPLDALDTDRVTTSVALQAGFAFLAERSSIEQAGLTSVDARDPGSLAEVGSFPYAEATAVAYADGRAYLLNRDALHIYDVTDPVAPLPLGTLQVPSGDYSALAVQGTVAAVAEGTRVHLLDVTDPMNPTPRGSLTVSGAAAVRLLLSSGVLHVVTGFGLELFNVSSPSLPTPLGSFPTPDWASAIARSGDIGYLVAGATLYVLDLAVPSLPSEIARLPVPDPAEQLYAVDVAGPLAVATGYLNHLYVFDVANPGSPALTGSLSGRTGFDVKLSGPDAMIATAEMGLTVINLSNPASPVEVGHYDTSGTASSLAVNGHDVFLATYAAQHWVMECTACIGCIETWPTIRVNSLRFVNRLPADRLSWEIAAGAGASNIHRTEVKSELSSLPSLPLTIIGTSATTIFDDPTGQPAGPLAHYQVFGRGSCTGTSIP